MDRSNVAKLVSVSYSSNGYGKRVAVESKREIFCSIESVTRAEYFSAWNSGLRPEIKLTTFLPDYDGETVCELFIGNSWVKYDIYRTFIRKNEEIELWCARKNEIVPQTISLYSYGKNVKLHGVYLTGSNGASVSSTGEVSTDTVTLQIPLDVKAFVGETAVELAKPKAYKAMTDVEKAGYFVLDTTCFFALGDIDANGKYQEINATYDDVYRIQSVSFVNRGKIDTEYIEVVGK